MSKLKDLTGKTCGYLRVICRMPNYVQANGRTRTRWLTLCLLCGNYYVADGSHILHGNVVSCGCLKNQKAAERMRQTKGQRKKNSRTIDLAGQIINENVYVNAVAPSKNGKRTWNCTCLLCGTKFDARANHLLRGLIRSCGCIKSFAEKKIREMFLENGISAETQYTFDDLCNPATGHMLYFDFCIKDDNENIIALLEYQGPQHEQNGEFGKQQREITDPLKREYCKAHSIPLYEIWYYQDLEKEVNKFIHDVLHVNPVLSKQKNPLESATIIP